MNTDLIMDEVKKIKDTNNETVIRKYNIQLLERIITRFASFSDCSECNALSEKLYAILKEMNGNLSLPVNKTYCKLLNDATTHFQKKHKLVTDGYYTGVYMSFGVVFGLIFGTSFSQVLKQTSYLGLGLPVGIGIGLAIGASMDAKAKKDGLVI